LDLGELKYKKLEKITIRELDLYTPCDNVMVILLRRIAKCDMQQP
jgi:hypothetical protein